MHVACVPDYLKSSIWGAVRWDSREKGLYKKNAVFWNVSRVTLVRIDVSEELSASFIRVTRIGELGACVGL
jgi:hypothetical protein